MSNVRVLIVDDSAVFRSQIKSALLNVPGIEVVSSAQNGKKALESLLQTPADMAIVDLEMPEMNGLEFLEAVQSQGLKLKVIIFASATKTSATSTLKALNRGAFDFVLKPNESGESTASAQEKIRSLILPKILQDRVVTAPVPQPVQVSNFDWNHFAPKAVVIGCSTGGPGALEKLFNQFNEVPTCPILIVQHMPPLFTAALGEHLSAISKVPVHEAKNGEPVLPGKAYVAPGGFHMRVSKTADGKEIIILDQNPQRHSVRPAVDYLFETAATVYGKNTLGFILTGMGEDGRDGCVALKKCGAGIIIQEKNSCVVYGMPKAVHDAGAYDKEVSLDEIIKYFRFYSTLNSQRKMAI